MSRKRSTGPPGDYPVGYGRPPLPTRFQPGTSGNPRGRPKGKKSIEQMLEDTLSRSVTVTENGTSRRRTMKAVIITGLVNDAARRDPKALRLLFRLLERCRDGVDQQDDAATLQPEDQAIIESFLASMQNAAPQEDGSQAVSEDVAEEVDRKDEQA